MVQTQNPNQRSNIWMIYFDLEPPGCFLHEQMRWPHCWAVGFWNSGTWALCQCAQWLQGWDPQAEVSHDVSKKAAVPTAGWVTASSRLRESGLNRSQLPRTVVTYTILRHIQHMELHREIKSESCSNTFHTVQIFPSQTHEKHNFTRKAAGADTFFLFLAAVELVMHQLCRT